MASNHFEFSVVALVIQVLLEIESCLLNDNDASEKSTGGRSWNGRQKIGPRFITSTTLPYNRH
jgi:hypothetical protein